MLPGSIAALLHLGEVVLGIAIEFELAHVDERIVPVRPDLGQVEGMDAVGLRVSLGHQLDLHLPFREIPTRNRVVQIARVEVEVGAGDRGRFFIGQGLVALQGPEVPLHPVALAVLVPQAVGVAAVAAHVAQGPDAVRPGRS